MENIVLINGSPKKNNSFSEYILSEVEYKLNEQAIIKLNINRDFMIKEEKLEFIKEADTIVIAMPTYIGSAPTQLLEFLEEVECYLKKYKDIKPKNLYAIVNCGDISGLGLDLTLNVLKFFAGAVDCITYGGGIAMGGGGYLSTKRHVPWNSKPKKATWEKLKYFIKVIKNKEHIEDIYTSIDVPRKLYILNSNMIWVKKAYKNKLSFIKLFDKPHIKEDK